MMRLTKKGVQLKCSNACEEAFQLLMKRLTTSPILIVPNNLECYVVYINVLGLELRRVLMQVGCMVAYAS